MRTAAEDDDTAAAVDTARLRHVETGAARNPACPTRSTCGLLIEAYLPKPSLQVGGHSEPLTEIWRQHVPRLGQLHLPVGGHRFRPTLEDVIELLIV
jgi:hypothetical protein